MFDLEHAIDRWKRQLESPGTITRESLEELEDHLRAEIAKRVKAGECPQSAFELAVDNLGSVEALTLEFDKVEPKPGRRFLMVSWAVFAVSFFLPVYRWSALWAHDLVRGWEAFVMSLDPEGGVFGVTSGLTNWLMVASLFSRFRRRRWLGPLMMGAAVLNAGWLLLIDPVRDLQIGYYAWWASFLIASLGLRLERRQRVQRSTLGEIVA